MKLDDKVGVVIDRLHELQSVSLGARYSADFADRKVGLYTITLDHEQLINNGPALHPLVKQMLVNRGIGDD